MGNSALKREQLARDMHRSRIQLGLCLTLKAEVVVSMADLRCSTRFDNVDLCGNSIGWAEPGGTHET